jgi:hypothetical protein
MIDVREFIRNLGDQAPDFFDTTDKTIQRWVKTGNIPIKAAQKVYAAYEASKAVARAVRAEAVRNTPPPADLAPIDPVTHLPMNIDRRLPSVQFQGRPPDVIEMNPLEQSFGVNMTRPGRVDVRPLPPMKLKDVGGQKVAYVDEPPKAPTVMPPTMPQDNTWSKPYDIKPPIKTTRIP